MVWMLPLLSLLSGLLLVEGELLFGLTKDQLNLEGEDPRDYEVEPLKM